MLLAKKRECVKRKTSHKDAKNSKAQKENKGKPWALRR
jgi:hypothetical protein